MFFMSSNKLTQLKIYYLFMYADGRTSTDVMQYLNQIISQMSLSERDGKKFVTFCDHLQRQYPTINSKEAISQIENILKENTSLLVFFNLRYDKKIQAETIWTLINLGYTDTVLSDIEITIITYLVKHWEVDVTLVREFYDIAETILVLEKQKSWIQTTSKPDKLICSTIEEIERSIDSLVTAVEISISESDIA